MNRKPNSTNQITHHQQTKAFSGPIPDSESLARYEEVEKGLAGRIVEMAEKEASHRHQRELIITQTNQTIAINTLKERARGQY